MLRFFFFHKTNVKNVSHMLDGSNRGTWKQRAKR